MMARSAQIPVDAVSDVQWQSLDRLFSRIAEIKERLQRERGKRVAQ